MLLKFKLKFHIKRHVTKKQDKICLTTFCVPYFIQILVIQAMHTHKKSNVADSTTKQNKNAEEFITRIRVLISAPQLV